MLHAVHVEDSNKVRTILICIKELFHVVPVIKTGQSICD